MPGDIWTCTIGNAGGRVPPGGDAPMRDAIRAAYIEMTGLEPDYIYSGWGGKLTRIQREIEKSMTERRDALAAAENEGLNYKQSNYLLSNEQLELPIQPQTKESVYYCGLDPEDV